MERPSAENSPAANELDQRSLLDRMMGVPLRIAIIVLLLAGLAFGMWWLTSSGPSERYRVEHPAGYSVVRPGDWDANIVTTKNGDVRDAILLKPHAWKGLEPSMAIRRLSVAPDFEDLQDHGYVRGSFGGRQAYVLQEKPKKFLILRAVFRDAEDWFEISVMLPGFEGLKIDDYWSYLLTFNPGARPATTRKP